MTPNDLEDYLLGLLSQNVSTPFLFVGSGFSRRYLGVEDWEGLLKKYCEEVGKPYLYYCASANSSYPKIASLLSNDYHEFWWSDNKFDESRTKNALWAVNKDSALKIEISRYLKERLDSYSCTEDLKRELKTLSEANIGGIITTNWDCLLNNLFPKFESVVGQRLFTSHLQDIGEIYKIHGCATEPNSLVLTAEDYHLFNERNRYLAAKLLTVFIEHPIIFVGYSLQDKNVHQILSDVALCLTSETIEKLKNRLIFVRYTPDKQDVSVYPEHVLIPEGRSVPLTIIEANNFQAIYEALRKIPSKFPAQLLRQIKKQVCELVTSQNPNTKLHVIDIDDEVNLSELEVVVGVGISERLGETGYKAITATDLLRDLVYDDKKYRAEMILRDTLPHLLKQSENLPVFKYLRAADRIDGQVINEQDLDTRVLKATRRTLETIRTRNIQCLKKMDSLRATYYDISDLVEKQSGHLRCLWQIPLLGKSQLDIDQLETCLKQFERLLDYGEQTTVPTDYRKLICLYDYLKYGPLMS